MAGAVITGQNYERRQCNEQTCPSGGLPAMDDTLLTRGRLLEIHRCGPHTLIRAGHDIQQRCTHRSDNIIEPSVGVSSHRPRNASNTLDDWVECKQIFRHASGF